MHFQKLPSCSSCYDDYSGQEHILYRLFMKEPGSVVVSVIHDVTPISDSKLKDFRVQTQLCKFCIEVTRTFSDYNTYSLSCSMTLHFEHLHHRQEAHQVFLDLAQDHLLECLE